LNWLVITPWKDDDEVMNIWKSYSELHSELEWIIIWLKVHHCSFWCNFYFFFMLSFSNCKVSFRTLKIQFLIF